MMMRERIMRHTRTISIKMPPAMPMREQNFGTERYTYSTVSEIKGEGTRAGWQHSSLNSN